MDKERAQTARNKMTHPDVLARLAVDGDPQVRMRVAMNPSTRSEVLDTLCRDSDPRVAASVANNPTATDQHFHHLAGHSESGVRGAVAASERASEAVLGVLAADVDKKVRAKVAINPHAGLETRVRARLAPQPSSEHPGPPVVSEVERSARWRVAIQKLCGSDQKLANAILGVLPSAQSAPHGSIEELREILWVRTVLDERSAGWLLLSSTRIVIGDLNGWRKIFYRHDTDVVGVGRSHLQEMRGFSRPVSHQLATFTFVQSSGAEFVRHFYLGVDERSVAAGLVKVRSVAKLMAECGFSLVDGGGWEGTTGYTQSFGFGFIIGG